MTNSPSFTAENFTDFGWLTGLSPLGIIFVFVLVLVYFVRRLKNIPTAWTWPMAVIGTLLYLLIAKSDPDMATRTQLGMNFIFGSIVSILGTLAAIRLHDKAFATLAEKWPIFSILIADDSTKPPTP